MSYRRESRSSVGSTSLRTALALALLLLATTAASKTSDVAEQDKVALLVGISRYSPSGGWAELHTEADLERIRGALETQGFRPENIHSLTGADADRKGIETAFRRHLIEAAGRGAVAVFHYSGHGQRITDDDFDEIDGYDETLVPFDAPQRLVEGYDGGKHLRDDDLHDWLEELRRKIGPGGDVLVSLDSCFSGAATRGLAARGSPQPLGPPQAPLAGTLGVDRAGGFVERRAPGAAPRGAGKLAPFIVISSARHDELAFETRDEQGRPIGSLSFALGSALSSADARTTYRGLHDEVKRIMAGHVRNRPQLEGDPNRRILGGEAIAQTPFFEIVSYDAGSKTAQVKGGALAGLLKGSKVVVHPPKTRAADSAKALAHGAVRQARTLTSEVVFDAVTADAEIEGGWLFVTEPAFGELRVRAYIGAGAWRAALIEQLESRRLIEQVDLRQRADVVIEEAGGGIELFTAIDGTPLLAPLSPGDPALVSRVREVLEDFARNRWLRRVEASSTHIRVRLEIRPCRLETTENAFGDPVSRCGADLERTTEGGELELRIGDTFELTLVNEGRKDAYVVVLDLMSDGRIDMLYPARDEMGEDNKLRRGKRFTIPRTYVVGEPLGNEILKLFASRSPVDFRPILSEDPDTVAPRGEVELPPRLSSGSVSTDSIPFTVSAAEGP